MTNLVINQQQARALEAGTAFRYAYERSKYWKAWIWLITLIFALVQTIVSANVFSSGASSLDLTPAIVGLLLLSVIAGSFGKLLVAKWQGIGCTSQRLHDFLVMDIGTKPTHIELPKSLVVDLSKKRLKKQPGDDRELARWWADKLGEVQLPVAKLLATFSTFAWECELRKKYHIVLTIILLISLGSLTIAAILLGYTISQAIIFMLAPFTPFISVVLDEWLTNRSNLKIAEKLTQECHSTWQNVLSNKLTENEMDVHTEQHMAFWQNYRQSATPIFEWLYSFTQKKMEMNMVINSDELIDDYRRNCSEKSNVN